MLLPHAGNNEPMAVAERPKMLAAHQQLAARHAPVQDLLNEVLAEFPRKLIVDHLISRVAIPIWLVGLSGSAGAPTAGPTRELTKAEESVARLLVGQTFKQYRATRRSART